MRLQLLSRRDSVARAWTYAHGPALTLAAVAVTELASRTALDVPDPGPLLALAVLYTTLRSGTLPGLAAAAVVFSHHALTLPAPAAPFADAGDAARRLVATGAALAGAVLLLAHYKRRLDRVIGRERAAREDAEAARREVTGILERITDGFFALDRNWRFTYVNARAEEFLGRSREQLLGRNYWQDYPELVGSPFYTEYYRAVADQVPVRFEAESRIQPGSLLEVHAYPSPGGLSVYFRNVTERKRALEALRAREDHFRELIENASDVILIVDLERRIRFIGPAVERLLGRPPAGLAGLRAVDFVHPDDVPVADAAFERAVLNPHETVSTELRVRHADGSWRVFEYSIKNLLHNPSIRGLVLNARDVTGRTQAEMAVRASEERYRSLFNGIPIGLYRSLPDGTILDANDALVQILGYPDRQVLLDTDATDLYLSAEDRRRFQELMATEGMVRGFETTLLRYDGSTVAVRLTTRAVSDASGRLTHYEGALEDITERLVAEEAARRTLELFRLLQRATNDPVYDWDLAGSTIYWNEATYTVFRYAPGEISLDPAWWTERLHPEDRGRILAGLQAALDDRAEIWSDEYRFRRGDGTYATVLDRGCIVRDEQGSPTRMIGSMTDVTERRRAEEERRRLEEQLRQAQKMEAVGRLAGGIAHDFNNLLTAVQGHAEVLLEAMDRDDHGRPDLEQIRRAAERGAVLTHQLLAFSRRQVLQPRVIDLNRVVREIESMLVRVIGEDIELATRLDPALGHVRADPIQIEQVIMNLVVNARDAMPAGGRISIETLNAEVTRAEARRHAYHVQPGEYVVLVVADTGHGMSAEVQAHIFEPFFTTKELGKGTGLGLSTVYGIIKQSGGYIWVESEEGAGTSFRILLPRVEPPGAGPPAVPGEAQGEAAELPGGSETVLLVEDEQAVRSLVRKILEQRGYTVLEARSGQEALRVSESHPGSIDLLLTDVVMPEMSGRELAERLLPRRPRTRVLFISGYTEDATVRHGIRDTPVNFLEKPFSPATLVRRVREVLDARGAPD